LIDVHLGNLNLKSVWDTGSGITIAALDLVKEHPQFFQAAVEPSKGTDSTGTIMTTQMFVMSPILIGCCEFSECRVAGVDLSTMNSTEKIRTRIILGYNILKQAKWIFNFP
jgi:hypothetical protein